MGNVCESEKSPTVLKKLNLKHGSESMDGIARTPNSAVEFKVIILGDSAVGKTSISMRFIENKFPESHIVTLGAKFQQPRLQLKSGRNIKMNLWDTSGEEKFRSMLPIYFRNVNGAILTYDIGDKLSFNNIEYWLNTLDDHVDRNDVVLYLIGNKKDMLPTERKVDRATAQGLADQYGMLFTEVSAKTGDGIGELFINMGEELMKKHLL